MSNIKRLEVVGELPFNCYEHSEMCRFLGQMNGPIMGIRIGWGKSHYKPNEHGGQTAFYSFVIGGEEAVSGGWVNKLLQAIRDSGGAVTTINLWDIENDELLTSG